MTVSFRLPLICFVMGFTAACSEPNPPPIEQAEITAPPIPTEVSQTVAVQTAATSTTTPAGPHGQQDPHAALDPERLIKVALQHDSEGRLELALKTLAEGIDKFPEAAQLYAVRASMRLQLQQVSAALADLEKAVQLAPDDAKTLVNRAQAYRAFGRFDEAMQDLNRAVEVSPDLVPALFNRGALHYARSQFDQALADFDRCIAADPHAPAPYFNRASTYWELGRGDEAVADLERFLELAENAEWKQTAEDLLKNWRTALTEASNTTQADS